MYICNSDLPIIKVSHCNGPANVGGEIDTGVNARSEILCITANFNIRFQTKDGAEKNICKCY